MALVCGVDEAGRGPVIGPMVMCGFVIDEKSLDKLKSIGVRDSKTLSPKQREDMFNKIKEAAKKFEIVTVTQKEIDEAVESDSSNLNWLEATKTAIILNKLKPNKAIVDSPSHNTKAYKNFLLTYLIDKKLDLKVENDAERYLPVAAASILAKVTRDREIEKLKEKCGDFGSGYPSDPKTKAFLEKNWHKYKEIFRKSWSSYKRVAGQKKLSAFTK